MGSSFFFSINNSFYYAKEVKNMRQVDLYSKIKRLAAKGYPAEKIAEIIGISNIKIIKFFMEH